MTKAVLGSVFGILVILGLWLVWGRFSPELAAWATNSQSTELAGSWGDTFGGFNALFGALGFSAVLATLLIQAKAIRDQQRDQHYQRFDTTFFQLIGLIREVRSEIRFSYSSDYRKANASKRVHHSMQKGPDAVLSAVTELKYWLTTGRTASGTYTRDEVGKIYTVRVHKRFESRLAPFFRLIYTVLDRLKHDQHLSDDEKARYGNLLRSQLTSHEISLMALNGTADVSKDLASLITEFHLLKYLPEGKTRRLLTDVYEPAAFAARD